MKDLFLNPKKNIKEIIAFFFSDKALLILFNIYFFSVVINTTTIVIDYPIINKFFQIVRYASYLYMILYIGHIVIRKKGKFNTDKMSVNIIALMVLFIGSLVINFTFTDNRILMLSVPMMIGFSALDLNTVIKSYFRNQMISVAVVSTLCVFGITQNYISMRGDIVRQALGFDYPTNLSQLVMFAMLYRLYLKDFLVNYKELLLFQVINIFVFVITDSKTELLFMEFLLFCAVGYSLINKLDRVRILERFGKWFVKLYLALPITSIILMVLYGLFRDVKIEWVSDLFFKLNNALSNRLYQSWMNFGEEGISLFGSKTILMGYGASGTIKYSQMIESNFIDNDYLNLLFTKGFVFFVAMNILIYFMLKILFERKMFKELFVCFIILTFALINPRLFSFEYSVLGVMMFNTLFYHLGKNEEINVF